MENTEQNAVKILPFESISQVANKSINYIKARKNHSIVSLKTRWDKFNKATGGIEPNMIFTIAGISGSGNSAFYLERKYLRYKEFCRLYKGLYRELSSKYGKDRKVNSVVNSQIAEG